MMMYDDVLWLMMTGNYICWWLFLVWSMVVGVLRMMYYVWICYWWMPYGFWWLWMLSVGFLWCLMNNVWWTMYYGSQMMDHKDAQWTELNPQWCRQLCGVANTHVYVWLASCCCNFTRRCVRLHVRRIVSAERKHIRYSDVKNSVSRLYRALLSSRLFDCQMGGGDVHVQRTICNVQRNKVVIRSRGPGFAAGPRLMAADCWCWLTCG